MTVKTSVHIDDTDEKFYTLRETAALFNVSYSTVRNWIYDGTLKATRVGGNKTRIVRVSASALKAICADEVMW